MATIGFIGLGIMGAPMALHLQNAGHKIIALKRKKPMPKDLAKGGAVFAATPKEVAQKSEIIITMVPDTPQVEEVLFGANGVASANLKGKLVIDMSSIAPLATKEFAKKQLQAEKNRIQKLKQDDKVKQQQKKLAKGKKKAAK